MLEEFVAASDGYETATDSRCRCSIARSVRNILPHLGRGFALIRAEDTIVSTESIVYELRQGNGEDNFGRMIEVCVRKATEEIACIVDGSKGHPNAGEWEWLRSIPLTFLTAVHFDRAQANVVFLVEHDATTGSHCGAVGDDGREETGRGHGRYCLLALCDLFVIDVDVIR